MKRTDTQIFMLVAEVKGVEDPDLIDNDLYTPIQCGATESKYNICALKDNTLEPNISELNWMFFENTGSYYIAKHLAKNYIYVGQCSYRRRLIFEEDFNFNKVFSKYDIILPNPYKWGKQMRSMYGQWHNVIDFDCCLDTLYKLYPEYLPEIDLAQNDNLALYYSSGFIMKSEDYIKYYEWLFRIFNKFVENYNLKTMDQVIRHLVKNPTLQKIKYNISICAFLQERLFSIYVEHNYPQETRYHVEYDKVNCKIDKMFNY